MTGYGEDYVTDKINLQGYKDKTIFFAIGIAHKVGGHLFAAHLQHGQSFSTLHPKTLSTEHRHEFLKGSMQRSMQECFDVTDRFLNRVFEAEGKHTSAS